MGGAKGDAGDAGGWSVHGAAVSVVSRADGRAGSRDEWGPGPGPGAWDATVAVSAPGHSLFPPFSQVELQQHELDPASKEAGSVFVARCEAAPGGRLVLAATGPLGAYDDVRSIGEAMYAGMRRAMAMAGAEGSRVVVWLEPSDRFPRAPLVALLAALSALYMPLQLRESFPSRCARVHSVGVCGPRVEQLDTLVRTAVALEDARGLARDLGGADPERMTPARFAAHVQAAFAGTGVRVRVETAREQLAERYPLLAAVARAADTVPRQRSCVVYLEYEPPSYDRTLMFVGKGVTYDTGGADIKCGGAMAGMSHDKCGAAAIAGFFKALWSLRGGVKAVCALGVVRNSVGEESYVADELLTSRSGLPVRVGNTDAEGRLVMADLLAEMSERACGEREPHIYTVATLTGHAVRSVGKYSVVMDNHVAAAQGHALRLQQLGDALGDMLEISTIRREDLRAHRGRSYGDALLQADNKPSVALPRGHQGPAAFLLMVAGLDTGLVPYSHVDIAGSAGMPPDQPTAAPLLALAALAGLLPDHGHGHAPSNAATPPAPPPTVERAPRPRRPPGSECDCMSADGAQQFSVTS